MAPSPVCAMGLNERRRERTREVTWDGTSAGKTHAKVVVGENESAARVHAEVAEGC